jgi:hypothetical protein
LVERGFISAGRPVRGLTSAIAEGNLATCRSGLRFADREIARLSAGARDQRHFDEELAGATERARVMWDSIEPYLDVVWPRVDSLEAAADAAAELRP